MSEPSSSLASEPEADQAQHKEEKQSTTGAGPQVGRPYQVELVEHALRENTIVNLGTGAGKTFVAVLTIKELAYQTEGEFDDEKGQRTVFLAHTVPLVKQQAEYIAKHTDLKVSPFYGEMKNIDSWSKSDWYHHFNENRVLVIICQIFLDMVNRGVIQPRQINLLIIDECHHATKNHPYVQIMRTIGDFPPEDHPRVLGLSASLLAKKIKQKPGELEKGIHALESVLMSSAKTSQDLQEVAKYATQPTEIVKFYNSVYSRETEELRRPIEGAIVFFHTKVHGKRVVRLTDLAKDLLDDLKIILLDLGPASAAEFVEQALGELRGAMAMPMDDSNWDYTQGCLALTHLTLFSVQCKKFKDALGDSSKVDALLEVLKRYGSSEQQDSTDKRPLRGIVFVERRYTASCLAKLLQRKSRKVPELRHIKCDYIVGQTASQGPAFQKKDTKMKSKQQGEVLTKFRKGRINLLISTSVIEEGVDVPKCNLVVRFDLPQNFRAYIQSKGRARDKPSEFILMVNEVDIAKVQMLNTFNQQEDELVKLCQKDRIQPSEEEMHEAQESLVPPYMPYGKDGARATLGGSLQLLHRYLQKLPCDKFTKLAPFFTVYKQRKNAPRSTRVRVPKNEPPPRDDDEEEKKFEYTCELDLPIVCPVKETIESGAMPSKRDAERAAGLFAVQKLHKLGELNERFLIAPPVDSDDEDVQKEKRRPLAGSEKRARLYRNRTASVLRKCFPHANGDVFLYVFEIRDRSTGKLYQSIEGHTTSLGVLTGAPLPWWKIPEFSLHVKDDHEETNLLVKVSRYPLDELQEAVLEVLTTCHEAIFSKFLCIAPPYLQPDYDDASNKYLVVPVSAVAGGAWTIDMGLVASICDSSISEMSWEKALKDQAAHLVVTPTHRPPQNSHGLPELYEVVSIDRSVTPQSPFESDDFTSYAEYYKTKYDTTLSDSQPGLKCKRLSLSRLKLFTSRFEQNHKGARNGREEEQSHRKYSYLFPDVTKINPLCSYFWKVLRCLPSLLWRMESLLLVDDLSEEISAMTRIGRISKNDLLLTRTTIHGYQDAGFGEIPTQKIEHLEKDVKVEVIASVAKDQLFLRGPDNGLLLQALTPRVANDSVNLERLESLGDSVLKLVTSLHLFTTRPTAHEEKLSRARIRRISNVNLRILAEEREINVLDRIMASTFTAPNESGRARIQWVMPCYKFQESSSWEPVLVPKVEGGPDIPDHEANYLYRHITDKCIADCVEALIGAYTVAGGLAGGIKFMSWLGVKIGKPAEHEAWFSNHPVRESYSLLTAGSRQVFASHFGSLDLPREDDQDPVHLRRLIAQTARAQEKLNYRFQNRLLLIQAFTHSSYTRNRITDCYKRLEFLGDAILDYLITSYAYSSSQSSTPQTMSELRSVVVSNTTFARLTVSRDLHKHLLHDSPALFKKIEKFAEALNDEESFDSLPDEDFMDDLSSSSEESMQAGEDEEEVMDDDSTCDELEGFDPPKVLGDILEALAAAVFLDSGRSLEAVWRVFKPILTDTPLFDAVEKGIDLPPITRLYHLVPDIKIRKRMVDRKYCCSVVQKGEVIAEAVADSLKNAKNMAALKALRTLGISN